MICCSKNGQNRVLRERRADRVGHPCGDGRHREWRRSVRETLGHVSRVVQHDVYKACMIIRMGSTSSKKVTEEENPFERIADDLYYKLENFEDNDDDASQIITCVEYLMYILKSKDTSEKESVIDSFLDYYKTRNNDMGDKILITVAQRVKMALQKGEKILNENGELKDNIFTEILTELSNAIANNSSNKNSSDFRAPLRF